MSSEKSKVPGRMLAAGEYFFEDLQGGDYFETGGIVVTESQIVAFAGISGDFFDVHMDDTFARAQGFPGRIAHGLLGLALIDGLKNRSPVRLMAIASLGWRWKFAAPIVANDRIFAVVTVEKTRLTSRGKGLVILGLAVYNQHQACVQHGETTLLCRQRSLSP